MGFTINFSIRFFVKAPTDSFPRSTVPFIVKSVGLFFPAIKILASFSAKPYKLVLSERVNEGLYIVVGKKLRDRKFIAVELNIIPFFYSAKTSRVLVIHDYRAFFFFVYGKKVYRSLKHRFFVRIHALDKLVHGKIRYETLLEKKNAAVYKPSELLVARRLDDYLRLYIVVNLLFDKSVFKKLLSETLHGFAVGRREPHAFDELMISRAESRIFLLLFKPLYVRIHIPERSRKKGGNTFSVFVHEIIPPELGIFELAFKLARNDFTRNENLFSVRKVYYLNLFYFFLNVLRRGKNKSCFPLFVSFRRKREMRFFFFVPDELRRITPPLFVKPVRAGSSYGISRVERKRALLSAVAEAFQYDDTVLIEEAIPGFEVGCAVMGSGADLTVGVPDEIELSQGFFDFTEKYGLITSQIHVPARITAEQVQRVQETAKRIYRALDCSGFARVDMFLTPGDTIVFNEVNTIPGFTPHSRFPSMMQAVGVSFREVLTRAIEQAVRA